MLILLGSWIFTILLSIFTAACAVAYVEPMQTTPDADQIIVQTCKTGKLPGRHRDSLFFQYIDPWHDEYFHLFKHIHLCHHCKTCCKIFYHRTHLVCFTSFIVGIIAISNLFIVKLSQSLHIILCIRNVSMLYLRNCLHYTRLVHNIRP